MYCVTACTQLACPLVMVFMHRYGIIDFCPCFVPSRPRPRALPSPRRLETTVWAHRLNDHIRYHGPRGGPAQAHGRQDPRLLLLKATNHHSRLGFLKIHRLVASHPPPAPALAALAFKSGQRGGNGFVMRQALSYSCLAKALLLP